MHIEKENSYVVVLKTGSLTHLGQSSIWGSLVYCLQEKGVYVRHVRIISIHVLLIISWKIMNWDNSTDKNIANNGEDKTTPKTKSLKCVPGIGKWVCKKKDNSNERNLSLCRRVQSFQLPWRRVSKLLPVIKQRSLWWGRAFVKSLYVENYDSKQ